MATLGTPARLPMLRRALAGFAAQTHAARELVVVVDEAGDVAAVTRAIETLGDDVRLLVAPRGTTLGACRNLAVGAARGTLVCQWDDDDLHHPQRIAAQLAALAGGDACALADVMLLDTGTGTLRWTNWAATPAGAHPGTLLARRDPLPAYPEAGPAARLGEDLAVLQALAGAGAVARLGAAPHLYVYVGHGANSWPAAHHAMLADSLAISRGLLLRREGALREALAPFGLAGTTVAGANGAAFIL